MKEKFCLKVLNSSHANEIYYKTLGWIFDQFVNNGIISDKMGIQVGIFNKFLLAQLESFGGGTLQVKAKYTDEEVNCERENNPVKNVQCVIVRCRPPEGLNHQLLSNVLSY